MHVSQIRKKVYHVDGWANPIDVLGVFDALAVTWGISKFSLVILSSWKYVSTFQLDQPFHFNGKSFTMENSMLKKVNKATVVICI